MMYNLGYLGAKGVEDADIILFTGGEDVFPGLYGEEALGKTSYNRLRDDYESRIFDEAKAKGVPMVGICRGGQFLNVKNDGKMWQHVDNHTADHAITTVDEQGQAIATFHVTSTHHQMMIPSETGQVLAVAERATIFCSAETTIEKTVPDLSDVEVVWYPDTGCLCFQPHPEFKSAPITCTNYFNECLDNFILPFRIERE
jgi:gamma-glutamyl-gamma-aminobutyrate hydrolase PuuD